jgi:hypothetical protein
VLSPIARAAPNDTVAIPKTIVILIAKLLPINRRPYIISDGELKLARFSFLYNIEHSLPDGSAINGAIMSPLAFLSKGEALALLKLVVDSDFLEHEAEIAFNAGRLDRSIVIHSADYKRIAMPTTALIAL